MSSSSIDAEFAKFEAELKELETKEDVETDSKKRKRQAETQVISAAPVRIMKVTQEPISTARGGNSMLNSSSSTAPAALSGFPLGISGAAANEITEQSSSSGGPASTHNFPRINMATGLPLPAKEQDMIQLQQSVYDYNPHKSIHNESGGNYQMKRHVRAAAGKVWEDKTLEDWPANDYRLFCGDLGNEVSDELLAHSFSSYPSFQRARVIRDKRTFKTKGFGFVSFMDALDCVKALREMNGKYIGNRPVKLSKSNWEDRNIDKAKKKQRKKRKNKNHMY